MNKKFMVNQDGKVIVVTNEGEIIERDTYTENTEEILSLENVIESLERKIRILNDRLKEHKNNKKYRKIEMIIVPITIIALTIVVLLLSGSLETAGLIGLIGIPVVLFYETISGISYIKSNNKEKICDKKIREEMHKIEKIQEKISKLSKNKTQKENTNSTNFTDVKPIYDLNFDASDYFIEKYQIDRRTKEMTKGHNKVRKLSKSDNSIIKY